MKKKPTKIKSLSDLGGMVFSTNPEFDYDNEPENEEDTLLEPHKQKLIIRYETAHRGGKKVTIVTRFEGSESQLIELGKSLKKHCGTGGSIVDGEIVVQGDNRQKIKDYLQKLGYKTNNI